MKKKNKIDLEYRGYITYFVIIIFKRKNVALVELLLTRKKINSLSRQQVKTLYDCWTVAAPSPLGRVRGYCGPRTDFISGSLIDVTAYSRRYRRCAERVHTFSRPRFGLRCFAFDTENRSVGRKRLMKHCRIVRLTVNDDTPRCRCCPREPSESETSRSLIDRFRTRVAHDRCYLRVADDSP